MVALNNAIILDSHVVINVAGQRFETLLSTLERFPNTRLSLLANLREKDENYDSSSGEFFFDRHPGVFSSILQYYRTEELHLDKNLCGNVVKCEFEFWGMMEQDIEPCCWTIFSTALECKTTLAAIDSTFLSDFVDNDAWNAVESDWLRFRKKVWTFLEDPSSSFAAKIYQFVSFSFVVVSIITFVLETWSTLRQPIDGANYTIVTNCQVCCNNFLDPERRPGVKTYDIDSTEPIPLLQYIDFTCFGFFLAEFLIHIFFAPSLKHFFQSVFNLIDIICIVTHLTAVILLTNDKSSQHSMLLHIIQGLRIVRVLRIFKLVKHYNAFRILIYTICMSVHELMLMIVFLLVGAVIFGSIIYVVEKENFRNIPVGLWWALVTMTTVGYGEFVPRETGGYLVGCICVIFGVLTIAFTVPIVVNNFELYYTHAQARNKKPKSYWRQKRIAFTTIRNLPRGKMDKSDLNDLNMYGNDRMKSNTYPDKQVFVEDMISSDFNVVDSIHDQPPCYFRENETDHRADKPSIDKTDNIYVAMLDSKKHEEHTRQLLVSMQEAEEQKQMEQRRQAERVRVRKDALEERKKRELAATNEKLVLSKGKKKVKRKESNSGEKSENQLTSSDMTSNNSIVKKGKKKRTSLSKE